MPKQQKTVGHPLAMRFITRMDYTRTNGWWVRISHGGVELASKLFSDKKIGGKAKALHASKLWRDTQLEKHKHTLAIAANGRRIHESDSRNLSGVIGVAPEIERRRGPPYITAWRAGWPEADGRQTHKRYSVADYGYKEAFRKAVRRRAEAIGKKVSGITIPLETEILRKIAKREQLR